MLRAVVQMLVTRGSVPGWMLSCRFRYRSKESLRYTSLKWPGARSVLEWASRAQLRLCHLALFVARDTLGLASSLFVTTVADRATSIFLPLTSGWCTMDSSTCATETSEPSHFSAGGTAGSDGPWYGGGLARGGFMPRPVGLRPGVGD